jgi:hypothetical protein
MTGDQDHCAVAGQPGLLLAQGADLTRVESVGRLVAAAWNVRWVGPSAEHAGVAE